nr:protein bonzai 3 [Quercus suber]
MDLATTGGLLIFLLTMVKEVVCAATAMRSDSLDVRVRASKSTPRSAWKMDLDLRYVDRGIMIFQFIRSSLQSEWLPSFCSICGVLGFGGFLGFEFQDLADWRMGVIVKHCAACRGRLEEERREEDSGQSPTALGPSLGMEKARSSSVLAVCSLSPAPSSVEHAGVSLWSSEDKNWFWAFNCFLLRPKDFPVRIPQLFLSASNLLDRDITSKSDPMAVVYAKKRDGKLEELGRTEVVLNSLNPAWIEKVTAAFQFEIVQPLVFHVYDVDSNYHNIPVKSLKLNDQEFLGEATCVLSEDPFLRISRIVESGGSVPICKTEVVKDNLNPIWKPLCLSIQQFGSKDNPLIIECFDFNSSGNHVLIGGFEINFMVAVDFTASNGNPQNPDSLHYIDPYGQLNSYQRVEGVEGIMAAYARALHNVALAGPTLFGPVINTAAQIAGQSISYNRNKYFVLLIITDGVVTDLQETKDALVRAFDLPLSILIVGVGGADFREMEVLDADNGRRLESSTGRVATRDIVQFVPMREVHSGQISMVQALLEELPG